MPVTHCHRTPFRHGPGVDSQTWPWLPWCFGSGGVWETGRLERAEGWLWSPCRSSHWKSCGRHVTPRAPTLTRSDQALVEEAEEEDCWEFRFRGEHPKKTSINKFNQFHIPVTMRAGRVQIVDLHIYIMIIYDHSLCVCIIYIIHIIGIDSVLIRYQNCIDMYIPCVAYYVHRRTW